jgi:hypothetical protein
VSRRGSAAGRAILLILLASLAFPLPLLLISIYQLFVAARLLDTYLAVILGHTILVLPVAVWLLKGFFDSLPIEVEECATVDGASTLQTIRYIVLPMARPGLTAAAIYCFVTSWNEFIIGLTFTSSTAMRPLPTGITLLFLQELQYQWPEMMAVADPRHGSDPRAVRLLPAQLRRRRDRRRRKAVVRAPRWPERPSRRQRRSPCSARCVQGVAVDDVVRHATGGERSCGGERAAREPRQAFVGKAQPVRRDDDVIERQQRIVGRRGLDLEDVEPGAGDAAGRERRDQRLLLDDRPARGVDQVGRRLHQPAPASAVPAATMMQLSRKRAIGPDSALA